MVDESRIASIEAQIINQGTRIASMEEDIHVLRTSDAVGKDRHQMIINRLNKIDDHMSRLVWIILTSLIVAVISFIIKGGLGV